MIIFSKKNVKLECNKINEEVDVVKVWDQNKVKRWKEYMILWV